MFGYREPDEDKKRKDVVKTDPTAAGRSAIRRTLAPRRRDNASSERRHGRASPRSVRLSLGNYVVDDRDGEIVIAPRSQTTSREQTTSDSRAHPAEHREQSLRTHRADVEDFLRMRRDTFSDRWHSYTTGQHGDNAQTRERQPSERVPRLRHAGSYVRESFLRNEVRHDDDGDEIDRRIRERAAAIPTAEQDWVERNRRYWSSSDDVALPRGLEEYRPRANPPGSERFAPAYRFTGEAVDRRPLPWATEARSSDRRSRSPPANGEDEASRATTPSAGEPGFPPLERQSARGSPVELRASTPRHDISRADGLGDRRRSVSPSEDAWETFMTTITQDERLPSAESSFTSATAASFSTRMDSQPITSAASPSVPNAAATGDLREDECDESGLGMHTPDSMTDSLYQRSANENTTSTRRPGRSQDHVPSMNLDGGAESPEPSQTFQDARRELQRDIETYSRSGMQRLLGSFLNRGESVPEELWQSFVPRNVLAGAAETGTGSGERADAL